MANSEKWAFRGVKGPKATVLATVSQSAAPDEVKSFLAWLVNNCPGDGVVLDSHAHEGGEGFTEHTSVRKHY